MSAVAYRVLMQDNRATGDSKNMFIHAECLKKDTQILKFNNTLTFINKKMI